MIRCFHCGGAVLQTDVLGPQSRIETVEQCLLCGREVYRPEFSPLPKVAGGMLREQKPWKRRETHGRETQAT